MYKLYADFGSDELDMEIGLRQKLVMILGQKVEFSLPEDVHSRSWALTRIPPGSACELNGRRLKPDAPGLYVLRAELLEGWARDIMISVFPREALSRVGFGVLPVPGGPPPTHMLERVQRLRNIVSDPRATPPRIIACLEPPGDPCLGLSGALFGEDVLNPLHFGGIS